MKQLSVLILVMLTLASCQKKEEPEPIKPDTSMYFPSEDSNAVWETTAPSKLGWDTSAIENLKSYLSQKYTRSFMILINGRIVMEEYFNGHTRDSLWEWNSAGKTLVSATTGIAQQEGLLNINDKASKYLDTGWTKMPLAKEDLITVRSLLTMTSGIDDSKNLIIKPNLTYVADAGTRWAYSNVFQKLTDIVASASHLDFETYFNNKLKNKIGMNGFWNFGAIYTIYHSNTRSMARFGLLALNKGKWKSEQVLNETYFNEMTNSSQNINPAYGYLCWLNGKTNYRIPGSQNVFNGFLVPNAPADMFAAMGAKDQRVYVIPSLNMVVVRMGEASDPNNPTFALSGFDNDLWAKMNAVIKK